MSPPVVIDMLNTSNGNESNDGVANYSKELHETAKLYLTRIQSALNKQICSFKKLISNEICFTLDKPISSVEESTVGNFEDLCKLVLDSSFTDELESERQLFHSSQCNINDLSENILQKLSEVPLPITDLVHQSEKLQNVTTRSCLLPKILYDNSSVVSLLLFNEETIYINVELLEVIWVEYWVTGLSRLTSKHKEV
ncbi:hypothetical protein KSF78_0002114 [Schistosoma japonicum]|nr:hypothetical protein KSF78_0002114 [Schistosoma japonicum]